MCEEGLTRLWLFSLEKTGLTASEWRMACGEWHRVCMDKFLLSSSIRPRQT